MGPRFRVSSERLENPGIEPTTPGLEGEQFNHYAKEDFYREIDVYPFNPEPTSWLFSIHIEVYCLEILFSIGVCC